MTMHSPRHHRGNTGPDSAQARGKALRTGEGADGRRLAVWPAVKVAGQSARHVAALGYRRTAWHRTKPATKAWVRRDNRLALPGQPVFVDGTGELCVVSRAPEVPAEQEGGRPRALAHIHEFPQLARIENDQVVDEVPVAAGIPITILLNDTRDEDGVVRSMPLVISVNGRLGIIQSQFRQNQNKLKKEKFTFRMVQFLHI